MIDYPLAKELKDGGFPQEERGGEVWDDEGTPAVPGVYEGRLYVPTLSELIEAIGPYKSDEFCLCLNGGIWEAILLYHGYFDYPAKFNDSEGFARVDLKEEGSTLEEAVVMLWLALNKK